MDVAANVAALEMNPAAIATLVRAMPADGVRWRPAPNEWSVLEVVNHLADEEREDFRTRLDYVLHRPGETPPTNSPGLSEVVARGYNTRDLGESLARFERERRQSLPWLRGLTAPDWSRAWERGSYSLRAGDLLASWAAHDLLHLRQLVELQYLYRARQAAPYSVAYAGDW